MHRSRVNSEAGSILIQVAIGMFVLVAMTTFVFDWGVMWVARRQAQNAADAGALAGAVALAFDPGAIDAGALGAATKAKQSAYGLATANNVWGEAPVEGTTVDATYPENCPDGTPTCLRVDVYRNAERLNPLPMFFGQLVGLIDQGVKATATAQAAIADSSNCLKPWAIPDKWIDHHDETPTIDVDTWTNDDTFETVVNQGPNAGDPLADPDVYVNPGFTLDVDYGQPVTLKHGDPQETIAPGNFFPICLPSIFGNCGGDVYRQNIANCNGVPIQIGDDGLDITTEPGNMVGPTSQGVQALIDQDEDAYWAVDEDGRGYVAGSAFTTSPRIVAVPVFDPAVFDAAKQTGRTEFHIVNILGFFLDHMDGNDVVGYFMTMPGLKIGSGPPEVDPSAAFLKVPLLVK